MGKKGGFHLKWPWNWILCGAFVLGAGYFIGYLWSALLAALFLYILKRNNPDMPQDGYCMERTRRKMVNVLWGLLLLFFAAAMGVYSYTLIIEDKASWTGGDYATLAVGTLGAAGLAGLAAYMCFVGIRDSLWPAKSSLANSIRSQLPFPDEAPDVRELFAMVDQDIRENGQWFDRVAVGSEWVLGDQASYIPRIRAVFWRDEIVRTRSKGGTQRILQLYIIDDRRQVQTTDLKKPGELSAVVNCLRLRAPGAVFHEYARYAGYRSKSEEEWLLVEREFRERISQLDQCATEQELNRKLTNPDFVLTNPGGIRSSIVSRDEILAQIRALQPGQAFELEALCPVPSGPLGNLKKLIWIFGEEKPLLQAELQGTDGQIRFLQKAESDSQARTLLLEFLEERRSPDLTLWSPAGKWTPNKKKTDAFLKR